MPQYEASLTFDGVARFRVTASSRAEAVREITSAEVRLVLVRDGHAVGELVELCVNRDFEELEGRVSSQPKLLAYHSTAPRSETKHMPRPNDLKDAAPIVDIFVGKDNSAWAHRTRILSTDGIRVLCLGEGGRIYAVPRSSVLSIKPIEAPDGYSTYIDSSTGSLLVRMSDRGILYNFGPVRGQLNPTINLDEIAAALGCSEVPCDISLAAPNTDASTDTSPPPSSRPTAPPREISIGELRDILDLPDVGDLPDFGFESGDDDG